MKKDTVCNKHPSEETQNAGTCGKAVSPNNDVVVLPDQSVMDISKRIIAENMEAYRELAK